MIDFQINDLQPSHSLSVECDFLDCPVNSECERDYDGVLCQCLVGYTENMTNGQFACIGKQLRVFIKYLALLCSDMSCVCEVHTCIWLFSTRLIVQVYWAL